MPSASFPEIPMRFAHVLVFTVALAPGCGRNAVDPDRQPVFRAGGRVTYRGAPVVGATVVFSRQGGRGAASQTDGDGRFQLRTYDPGDGACAGEYVVVVQKLLIDQGWTEKMNQMNFKSTQEYEDWKLANKVPRDLGITAARSQIPNRYGDSTTTPLRATIAVDSPNEFTFELTD